MSFSSARSLYWNTLDHVIIYGMYNRKGKIYNKYKKMKKEKVTYPSVFTWIGFVLTY